MRHCQYCGDLVFGEGIVQEEGFFCSQGCATAALLAEQIQGEWSAEGWVSTLDD